jgi:hypothetical protein
MKKQEHWFDLPVEEINDLEFTPGLRKKIVDLQIREHSTRMGVPTFISIMIQWYQRNRAAASKCGMLSLEDSFDELGALIGDAIQNWDKDPIVRKLQRGY